MAPDDPFVAAFADLEGVGDVVLGQRLVEGIGARADQVVVLPDAHPQQLELLVRDGRILEELGIGRIGVVRAGATRPQQLEDNVKAAGVKLDADLMKAIDDAVGSIVERDPAKTESPAERP